MYKNIKIKPLLEHKGYWEFGKDKHHPDYDLPSFHEPIGKKGRLYSAAARRKVTVRIFNLKGYVSTLHLDSGHYDRIGWSKASLDDYMRQNVLKDDQWYTTERDRIID